MTKIIAMAGKGWAGYFLCQRWPIKITSTPARGNGTFFMSSARLLSHEQPSSYGHTDE